MPKKTSVFVVEQDRRLLPNGRVAHVADLSVGGAYVYQHSCVCSPEDEHDHEGTYRKLLAGAAHRDELMAELENFRGKKWTEQGVAVEITDANIEIEGPERWTLFLSWLENGQRQVSHVPHPHPLAIAPPAELLEAIASSARAHAARIAAAQKVAAFEAGK